MELKSISVDPVDYLQPYTETGGTAEGQQEAQLLIVWMELEDFDKQSYSLADIEIAATLEAYYECVTAAVVDSGGRVVKHVGERVLAVFGEAQAQSGVSMLVDLKNSVDELMEARSFEARMRARVHFGRVIEGVNRPGNPGDRFS